VLGPGGRAIITRLSGERRTSVGASFIWRDSRVEPSSRPPCKRGLAVRAVRAIVASMSTVTEIESAIEALSLAEQRELADWLASRLIEETPEMLAALDAGIRSLETEPKVSLEAVRGKIKAWATT
jgi:hypothetical protein